MSVNLVCLNSFLFVVDNLLELRAIEKPNFIVAVKTSGCPDILYNDWAASRNQSMQRPKSLQ